MRKLRALTLLVLVVAGNWPPRAPGPAVAALPAAGKVAGWVSERTAAGQTAEFLVVLDQQADLSAAAHLHTRQAKGRYVYAALRQTAEKSQAPLLAWLEANQIPHRSFYIVNMIWVAGDATVVQALAARADVARLDGNPTIVNSLHRAEAAASSAPDGVETNISYVNADDVWTLGYTGQGIVIGGQDTGYQWDHPALKPHYRGWDGSTAEHDFNWHDSIHTLPTSCGADAPAPCDDHGHGTHTMGTALGDDGAANEIGMAPGAQWIGCRNMRQGIGTPATYLECFEWFLAPYPVGGTPDQGNPDLAPHVTNNSWGCPPDEGCAVGTLQAAVEAQRAAGIFTVVSAGNKGISGCATVVDPPALYDAAYTVGALTKDTDIIAGLSSRGPVTADGSQRRKPDITAPGTSIRSSVPGNGYGPLSGTSMAVPHVVGAVALLWSARPALRGQIDLTEEVLNQSAVHITSTSCSSTENWPNNTYGYGRLDVLAAVTSVTSEAGTPNGTVTDKFTDGPVAGATIQATLMTTPTTTFAITADSNGSYSDSVFPGVYTVTVTHPLRRPVTVSNVIIGPDTITTENVQMDPILLFPAYLMNIVSAQFAHTRLLP
jgi:subtilisin family serine protease